MIPFAFGLIALRYALYSVGDLRACSPGPRSRSADGERAAAAPARPGRGAAVRVDRGERAARLPQRGGRSPGGRHRDLPPGGDAGPARDSPLHLRGLPAGRERGARAPGAPHRRPAGLAAGRPGHRLPCSLRAVHRLHRRLGGHHRGPGRPALPRSAAGALPRAVQPGARHHLGQPGAALRPGASPDPVRRRGAADESRAAGSHRRPLRGGPASRPAHARHALGLQHLAEPRYPRFPSSLLLARGRCGGAGGSLGDPASHRRAGRHLQRHLRALRGGGGDGPLRAGGRGGDPPGDPAAKAARDHARVDGAGGRHHDHPRRLPGLDELPDRHRGARRASSR